MHPSGIGKRVVIHVFTRKALRMAVLAAALGRRNRHLMRCGLRCYTGWPEK